MKLSTGATRAAGVMGCTVVLASAAGALLFRDDDAGRPVAARTTAEEREPSLSPPSSLASLEGTTGSDAEEASPAALASDTWAALPTTLDDEAPDQDEVMARELMGAQLITWLAEEEDPDAALVWADQIGELARWLRREDRARLLSIARGDAQEARRQAALVALGRLAAVDPSHVTNIAEAHAARPTSRTREGLQEVLVTLRAAGVDVRPIERALER